MRDLELPGRSPVHGPHGMAATSHVLSTQTAVEILKAGGNAMDAAVAACAVQCVVEPESTGIGGDCFCLYAPEGTTEISAINGSGKAPMAASVAAYANAGVTGEIPRQSPHAVVVPGAVDAWARLLARHGTMSLGALLQPAIDYARNGYPVSSRVHADWVSGEALLAADPTARRIFLPDGRAPRVGQRHRQPELADTLTAIAEHGPEVMASGWVADDIVSYLQSLGGLHTAADFAAIEADWTTPISTRFRGLDVYECPPAGQGVIALMLLNMAETVDPGAEPITLDRVHWEIEAARLAYTTRGAYLADPRMSDVPVAEMLSKDYAARVAGAIDMDRAQHPAPLVAVPRHEDTVYISVVDKDRNCASFINTLFSGFGSGLCAPKSGVMLTNRAQGFVLTEGHPNAIEGGKRPLHTIIPGMVAEEGRVTMPFGVMGGQYQAHGHMQFLTRLIDYGCDLQEAQDLPRFMPDPFTGEVEVEDAVGSEIIEGLRARGHKVVKPGKPVGGSQAIRIDWDENMLTGGSDPRKDGAAIGY